MKLKVRKQEYAAQASTSPGSGYEQAKESVPWRGNLARSNGCCGTELRRQSWRHGSHHRRFERVAAAGGECPAAALSISHKEGVGVFREGRGIRYAWSAAHRQQRELTRQCEAPLVRGNGYRAWRGVGSANSKRTTHARRPVLIQTIHDELKGACGSPRMVRARRERRFPASRARVERLMRECGIKARHKRRFKATTDSKHALATAPNLLDRDFTPAAPSQVLSADLTYIWTNKGWAYLAVVLDLFSREIVGWSITPRVMSDIVIDALTMGWLRRKRAPGLIHHSDRGSQYASQPFQAWLQEYGMVCSTNRMGNCWDNAQTESFSYSLKNERVHGSRHPARAEAKADLFDCIERFYSRKRTHSTLGYASPAKFLETCWVNDWLEHELAAELDLLERRRAQGSTGFLTPVLLLQRLQ